MIKRILMTGVTGFLGQNIVKYLVNRGYDITGTWNQHEPERHSDHIKYVQIDLGDKNKVEQLFAISSFDAVIHLAGQMRGKQVKDYLKNSVASTEYLIEAAQKNVKTFIYASSISIYGYMADVDEDSDRVNLDDYGTAKYLCERLLEDSTIENRIAIRLPRMLGKNLDFSYPWLPKLTEKLLKNEDVQYFNPESLYNNLAHVDTLSEFLKNILSDTRDRWKGYHVVVIGSAHPIRVIDIIQQLKEGLRSTSILREVKEHLPRNTCLRVDITRAEEYGYIPWTVEDTLARFIEDLKKIKM